MRTGFRLIVCSAVIAVAIAYMAYLGASSGWSYYVTVDECVERIAELRGSRLRVSGRVATGSLVVAGDRTRATFRLEGEKRRLVVRCRASVPDGLAEGREVVVEGRIVQKGEIEASQVLTRCASKYTSGKYTSTASAASKTLDR